MFRMLMALYLPRDDSHLLATALPSYIKGHTVLDMGAGSGFLAEAALKAGAASVCAVDIDAESIAYLQHQKLKNTIVIRSDLFSNVKGAFDVILCNPPYLPRDAHEPRESARATTGGKRGDEFILRFLTQSLKHLAPHGIILLLLSSLTPRERINKLLASRFFTQKTIAQKKLFFEELEVWEIARTKV